MMTREMPVANRSMTMEQLLAENAELSRRLEEAEETLRAIQTGAVDAFVVEEDGGQRIYTLESADRPYRLMVEQMQQGAATLHTDGTILYCNLRLAEMLKLPHEKLIGSPLRDYVDGDDRLLYQGLLRQGQHGSGGAEARLRDSDGNVLPAFLTLNALPGDFGGAVGVLVTDLTTQKHHEQLTAAHQALRESEARMTAFLDELPVGVGASDRAGRWMITNALMRAFAPQQIPSRDPQRATRWQAFDAAGKSIAIDDWPGARALRGETVSAGVAMIHTAEDGTKTWTRVNSAPLRNTAGAITGAICVIQDIDLIKQAELALRQSEERFRELANNIDLFAWTCDELGEATWYNRRWYEYTGTTFDEMRGDGWKKVQHPEHLDRVVQGLQKCRASGENWEDTFPLRGQDGNYRWFLSRAVPIRDESGRVTRWLGTNTDVTELRRLEENLRDADRRKDEFLATLAHELRNPLAPVMAALEVMRRTGNDPALVNETRSIMLRQMEQMVRLVDDLLDVSRITRDRLELRREKLELKAVIHNAVEAARPLAASLGHELQISLPQEAVDLDADPARLTQVFGNLLNNACKFTPRGGRISLDARREGAEVVVRVKDTGIGIASDKLAEVFGMFAQIDRSLSRSQGGLGIGLTLVQRLVEMHGGTVWAESEGAGRGALFVVCLPLASAE